MAYPFTEEHDMIRAAARGFLQNWYDGGKGPEAVYGSDASYDPAAWQVFAGDMGMAGIAVDEDYGGAGLGDLGRVAVMEELGASLCAIPFLTSGGVAVDVLSRAGEPAAKRKYLKKIAAGALKLAYCDGHHAENKCVNHVAYADIADVIILSRSGQGGLDYFAIRGDAKGLKITPQVTMDPTRSFASVDWSGAADSDLEIIGYGSKQRHAKMITQSMIALAAESIGGAQACLDMTLAYSAQRIQFDRPIASFQAVKHRCADMFVLIEAARSAVYAAATASPAEKIEAAIIAKAYACDAFFKVAGDAIQLHGGIGFTWEYPLHFFFKRARANRAMFSATTSDYDQLAALILGEAA